MHRLFVGVCVLLRLSSAVGQDAVSAYLGEPSSAASIGSSDQDIGISVYTFYLRENCGGVPNRVDAGIFIDVQCDTGCQNSASSWKSWNISCNNYDYQESQDLVASFFEDTSYLLIEKFQNDCQQLYVSSALVASDSCTQINYFDETLGHGLYETVHFFETNGSLSVRFYMDDLCTIPSDESIGLAYGIPSKDIDLDASLVNTGYCDENGFKWSYFEGATSAASSTSSSKVADAVSSASGATSVPSQSSSGSNTGVIAGIIGGIGCVLILVGFIVYKKSKHSGKHSAVGHNTEQQRTASLTGGNVSVGNLQGQSGLWTDDVVTAKRVSRRDVEILQLITRGAFGEVYEGKFDGGRVAVKMLPPETRGIIHHVNSFLAEAKLTASMEHPRIITIIGIAWNSLSDLCVVMEYMEGGDLRSLLNEYESTKHPVGIDRQKATIALHVCHALAYLHSLAPAVIHRDLKSRNILLNQHLEAKLTDFGISRERLDQTMTAGVGTSLWMAPEVMLGQKYDDKADMFSFGVVLSELDVHTLPYAQSKDQNRDSKGKRLPDALVLQKVAMGKLTVDFSEASPKAIVDLGVACVAVDPRIRPTAAEALYKLQVALTEEL
ncbi:hypothetical protein V7S43_005109 [Phytophthora oleae]|uniref:Protein kinase domain-containing protein n=1 Tax=Phytophthora oleae TaxID=2107226 RepID=A0ABD3FVV0_9STRA